MFCQKCGAQIADDAKFCNSCGATVGNGSAPAPAASAAPVNHVPAAPAPTFNNDPVQTQFVSAPPPTKKKKNTGLIIGIVAGVIVVVGVVIGILFGTGVIGGDKPKDKEDAKVEESIDNKDDDGKDDAVVPAKKGIEGNWRCTYTQVEDGMELTIYIDLALNKDGTCKMSGEFDMDKIVGQMVDMVEAEYTQDEIDQMLDYYGYASLEEYASKTLEAEFDDLEDEFEVKGNWKADGNKLYIWEDGETEEDAEIDEFELDGDNLTIKGLEDMDDMDFVRQ